MGKSSLCRTLEQFSKNPSKFKPVLTGESVHKGYLQTKVLDVIKEVLLENKNDLLATSKPLTANVSLVEVHEEKEKVKEKEQDKINISFIDIGGHTEYFFMTNLFFTSENRYAVLFEGHTINKNNYHSRVGTYINIILQSSMSSLIFLVASKMDLASKAKSDLSFVLKMATEQVKILTQGKEDRQSVNLFNEVLMISSKNPVHSKLRNISSIFKSKSITFQELASIFSCVLGNDELIKNHQYSIPNSWANGMESANSKDQIVLKISEFEELNEVIKKQTNATQSINHLDQKWQKLFEKVCETFSEEIKGGIPVNESSTNVATHLLLQYLATIGEIFLFPHIDGLSDKVIVKPLEFVKEIR